MRRVPLALAALVLAPSLAGAIEDVTTPRSLAMGNALRADATGALAPLLNPAGMVLTHAYTLEASYGFRVQDLGSSLHLSITDSVTSARVAAGIYYDFVHGGENFHLDPATPVQATRQGSEWGLAIAVPLGDKFALGLTAKYMRVSTSFTNPAYSPTAAMQTDQCTDPTSPTSPNCNSVVVDTTTDTAAASGFTVDFGLALKLGDSLNLAVVGYNLIPLRSIDGPLSMGFGAAYHFTPALMLAADGVVYFDKLRDLAGNRHTTGRVGGGLEWLIAGKVPLRAGAFWDSGGPGTDATMLPAGSLAVRGQPGTYVSGGIGYLSPRFGIDVAYRGRVQGGSESVLIAGVRVFLE